MKEMRVLLADDHTLIRAGIRSLLEKSSRIIIVGEAADGREAVALTKTLQPNIVVMDIAMPGMNGLEATARIVKECPDVRVIILSMHSNEEYVLQALRAGTSGYLLKKGASSELEHALRAVARGDTFLSPAISKRVINLAMSRSSGSRSSLEQLTPRQREILQLVAEGKTNKEIAFLLNVGMKTIEAHRTQLMKELGIHDIAGLVRYAIRFGLVSSDE